MPTLHKKRTFSLKYFQRSSMLVDLGLMTALQRESMPYVELSDGTGGWETGVSYADFENACLKHLSNAFFNDWEFSCLKVQDGKLIVLDIAHGGDHVKLNGMLSYLNALDGVYWYTGVVDCYGPGVDDWTIEPLNFEIAFVFENGNYVIDEIKFAWPDETGNEWPDEIPTLSNALPAVSPILDLTIFNIVTR